MLRFAWIFLLLSTPATAADPLEMLCNLKPAHLGKVFARASAKDFPKENILSTFEGFAKVFGKCVEFRRTAADEGELLFKEASQPLKFELDTSGKIVNIAFKTSFIRDDSFEKILAGFEKGTAGIYASKGREAWFQLNENKRFSMGDTALLLVEKAYRNFLKDKPKLASETVELRERDKFRTSSLFSDWPEGAKISADSLSLLMLRQRDRIASDLLIRHLGQKGIPEQPFYPTFGQLYQLYLLPKSEAKKLLQEAGLEGIEKLELGEKKFQLSERDGDEYDSFEAGWYVSPKAICEAFYQLRSDSHLKNIAEDSEGFEFLFELQGAFPSGKSLAMLGKRKGESEWRCISFAVSPAAAKGKSLVSHFDRLRRLLGFL